jgi:hypothetical protein
VRGLVGVIFIAILVWTAVARHRFSLARLDGPSIHPARQAAPYQSGIKLPHSKFLPRHQEAFIIYFIAPTLYL